MKTPLTYIMLPLMILMTALISAPASAQEFSVASFRDLPNATSTMRTALC